MTDYTEEHIASIEQRILKWQGYRTVQDEFGFWSILKPDCIVGLTANCNAGENELWEDLAPHPWTDLNAAFEALRFARENLCFSERRKLSNAVHVTVVPDGGSMEFVVAWPDALLLLESKHICLALIQYLEEQQHQPT